MKSKRAYLGRGALNLIGVCIVVFVIQALVRGRVPDIVGMTILVAALFAAYLGGVRWIERRQPDELIHRAGPSEFVAGVALGIGLFATVMLILRIGGVYHASGWGSVLPLAAGFLFSLLSAVLEEIIFRGLLFRLFEKATGMWGALALTSILFGAAHAANRSHDWQFRGHCSGSRDIAGCGLRSHRTSMAPHRSASGMELCRRLNLWHGRLRRFAERVTDHGRASWKQSTNRWSVRSGSIDCGGSSLPDSRDSYLVEEGTRGEG